MSADFEIGPDDVDFVPNVPTITHARSAGEKLMVQTVLVRVASPLTTLQAEIKQASEEFSAYLARPFRETNSDERKRLHRRKSELEDQIDALRPKLDDFDAVERLAKRLQARITEYSLVIVSLTATLHVAGIRAVPVAVLPADSRVTGIIAETALLTGGQVIILIFVPPQGRELGFLDRVYEDGILEDIGESDCLGIPIIDAVTLSDDGTGFVSTR